jgi:HEAT repeat protein
VEALVAALRSDSDAAVRADAAVALADAGAREVLSDLVETAQDAHLRVRQMVVVALGELGQAEDAEALEVISAAADDDAPALRFQALIALHRILGDESIERVIESTRDPDDHVRYVALRILEEHWEEAREPLAMPVAVRVRAMLRDDAPAVRLAAAILLGRGGDRSGSDELVAAVNERSGRFQLEDELAAVELAGKLGLERARDGLSRRAFGLFGGSNDASAFQARVALAQLGDARAEDAILRGLSAWSRDARTLAVAAAGRAQLRAARPVILAMRGNASSADPHAVEEALALLDAEPSAS